MAQQYLIAEPQRANPLGAALAGFGAVQDIQGNQSKNYLMQAQTQLAQQNVEKAQIESGMEYGYLNQDGLLNPETYGAVRNEMVKRAPALKNMLPEKYDPSSTPQLIARGVQHFAQLKGIPGLVPVIGADGRPVNNPDGSPVLVPEKSKMLKNPAFQHMKPGDWYKGENGQMQQVPWGEPGPVQQSVIDKNRATAANQKADMENPTRRHVEPTTTVLNSDGTVKAVVQGRAVVDKGLDPDKAKDKIEKDVRTGFKFTGDIAEGFKKQAEVELFKNQDFEGGRVPGKYYGTNPAKVPFSQLPGEEKGKIRDQYKDQIATKSRELYEAEVQKRVDTKFGQRQKQGAGMTPDQLAIGKAMKVGDGIVGRFPDGLYNIDANGTKLGRYAP